MVVTALPDLAGAIVAYLRASAPVAAIVGTKVSAVRQESWALPAYAVLVETGRGGPGEIDYGPIQDERVQITTYGPDARTAHLLWRTVHVALISPDQSHPVGFVAASTRVLVIYQEGGPLRLTDPDTNWPYTTTPYRFRYSGVPAA
jgi:hypothetical protein